MTFAEELAEAIPKRDPTEGPDNGDELRLVSRRSAKQYVAKLIGDAESETVRARFAKAKNLNFETRAPNAGPPPSIDHLISTWTSGDTAIVVRLRDGRPLRMVFLRRETKTRARTTFLIGGMDKGLTIHRALFAVGIRTTVSTTTSEAIGRKLVDQGYSKSSPHDFEFKLTRKP